MKPQFDAKALFSSLDKQRIARGMSWMQVSSALAMMSNVIPEMTAREVLDTNDVLQMTRWLGLNIESFSSSGKDPVRGPQPGDVKSTGRKLRLDTAKLYAALDRKRSAKGLSWDKVSTQIGSPRATVQLLANLQGTSRVDVRTLLAILDWLGGHSSSYTRLDALEPIGR